MLSILNEFREKLDNLMLPCLNRRVAIYGYNSYTGRFLKWYGEYYHSIKPEFLISEDMSVGHGYELEIFRPSVLDFGYRDIRNAVIWLAQPLTDGLPRQLREWEFGEGINVRGGGTSTSSARFTGTIHTPRRMGLAMPIISGKRAGVTSSSSSGWSGSMVAIFCCP